MQAGAMLLPVIVFVMGDERLMKNVVLKQPGKFTDEWQKRIGWLITLEFYRKNFQHIKIRVRVLCK